MTWMWGMTMKVVSPAPKLTKAARLHARQFGGGIAGSVAGGSEAMADVDNSTVVARQQNIMSDR